MEARVAPPPPLHRPLLDLIESRLAIVLTDHRIADIMKVVSGLSGAGTIADAPDLTKRLVNQSITHTLWQQLIRVATIGETYFYRDHNQLDALSQSILPQLINERMRTGRRELKLWSAGCSTGEESYSLAMILRDLIPDIRAWKISLLATDLNVNHIERAQRGLYRTWSFRTETPSDCRDRWFVEEDSGYRLDPSIRNMVTFAPLNLADSTYLSQDTNTVDIDIILCRNVLIYFDSPTVAAILKRFHGALGEKGWLVVGHSETAHMTSQSFIPVNFEKAILFQKQPTVVQPLFRPIESVDKLPVSKPALLAPRIAPKPTTIAQGTQQKSAIAVSVTEKLDPWTLAHFAANREDWDEALRCLAEAELTHKMRPEVHYLRGIVELQQGDTEKTLFSLRRAIYCKPDFVLAHFTLGEIYEKQGYLKKAWNEWRQAHDILTNLPPADLVESSDNLTVEMLTTVLEFRLDNLFDKSPRRS